VRSVSTFWLGGCSIAPCEIYQAVFGPGHPRLATVLIHLGELKRSLKHPEEAESLLRQAMAILAKRAGRASERFAAALNSLAGVYTGQNRYDAAEPLLQRSLVIVERLFGRGHPDYAAVL
jgi:tetratricopeptide (TPR) repeat protein